MKAAFVLAAKYLAYHRGRTALMVLAIALTAVLPLTAHWLIDAFSARLLARAIATPAVVGPRGDRYNLVLQSLYFAATDAGTVTQDDVRKLQATGMARAIPLHLRYSAGGTPLVGTSHAYFAQRGLRPAAGTLPLRLGQAVVGSAAAERLELAVGETLITDQRSLYDISATYPLKLHIVGILAATGTADDDAVFVDIKTTWVVDGLIHGHRDVSTAEAGAPDIAERSGGRVRANAAIVEYQEITAANAAEFHLHGDSARLPVSAILVIPHDAKAATLLQARYDHSETRQMLRPEAVVREMMDLVFRVKRFFDANFALVALSAGIFLVLILLLSRQLRAREIATLHRIGCQPGMTGWIQAAELIIVIALSAGVTLAIAQLALGMAPRFTRLL
jgi:putative ABC transport system permease protein